MRGPAWHWRRTRLEARRNGDVDHAQDHADDDQETENVERLFTACVALALGHI